MRPMQATTPASALSTQASGTEKRTKPLVGPLIVCIVSALCILAPSSAVEAQDFFNVPATFGVWPTGEVFLVDTSLDLPNGSILRICAKGSIELTEDGPSNGPDGRAAIGNSNFWLPGAPEGALLGRIGSGPPFAVGSCFQCVVGTSPCIQGGGDLGRLELGINDEFYEDNSGSFKVKIVNFDPPLPVPVGNMNPVGNTYVIVGQSDAMPWSFGFALPPGAPAPPPVPGPLSTSPSPLPNGAPDSEFAAAFVSGTNGDLDIADPYCVCAIDGIETALVRYGNSIGPGFPQPFPGASAFTVFTGGSDTVPVDLWVSAAGAPGPNPPLVNNVNAGPPVPAGPPFVGGVSFNPELFNIAQETICGNDVCEEGEDSETCPDDCAAPGEVPTVSEWGLIIMTLLALTAGTIVFARRRRPASLEL